jgi:parallel beta-helix repeat protein
MVRRTFDAHAELYCRRHHGPSSRLGAAIGKAQGTVSVPLPNSREHTVPHDLAIFLLAFSLFLVVRSWPFSELYANGAQLHVQTFNVRDYGAKGDSRVSTSGSMEKGSSTLICLDCSLSENDIGKKVYVYGASSAPYALSLDSTIRGVPSPTSAILEGPATQSTSGALVQLVGTNDTKAILAGRAAACAAATASNPAVLLFPRGGVYTLNGRVIEPCSNLRVTGSGTILQVNLNAGRATGQGAPVIVFPGSPTGRFCNGGIMTAESNVLRYGSQGDKPCNFTPADVGSRVVVAYAGQDYLPLYATIKNYVSNTQVNLDRPARTAVPVTNSGFGKVGTLVEIAATPIENVEIDHLTLMNVTTAYPPGRTLGIGIVALGADSSSVKQGVRVHDLTVMTASINCLGGNNGVLDQYEFEHNTLIGCADASMYVAGWNSRGSVSNNTIENGDFPGVPAQTIGRVLYTGILVKGASNVTFADNTIRINAILAGIAFGDWPQFRDRVQNNNIAVSAQEKSAIGIEGNTGDHILLTGNRIECQAPQGRGIWFYSKAVSNVEATGNVIRSCQVGIKVDGTGSGVGPASVKLKGNNIYGCREGIRLENVGGINVVENNRLSGCSGDLPWLVLDSQAGSVTYFTADNVTDDTNPMRPKFDSSVRRLPTSETSPR